MTWHKRLTQAREAKGIKKSAFAELVGVKPSSVTDWENGDTKMIDGANLVTVCAALDISPGWLINGNVEISSSGTGPKIPKSDPPGWIDPAQLKHLIELFTVLDERGRAEIIMTAEDIIGACQLVVANDKLK